LNKRNIVADLFDASHVMGRKDDGMTLFLELKDLLLQLFRIDRVKARENGSSKTSKSGSCSTVMINCTFCAIPFDSSSSFRFHHGIIPNLSNQARSLRHSLFLT
jgi:hypothetical protein